MPDAFNPATDEIVNEGTRYINGQLMTWQPDPKIQEAMDYLGIDREAAARMHGYTGDMADIDKPGSGAGGWVPGTYKEAVSPWKIIGAMALAGAGGSALAAGLPALLGGGAAAAGGAGAAAPSIGATTGLTAAQAAALPGALGGAALGPTVGLTAGTAAALPGAVGTGAIGSGTATGGGMAGGGGYLNTIRNIFGVGGGKGSTTSDLIRLGTGMAGDFAEGRAADRAQQNAYAAADDQDALNRYAIERANAITQSNARPARLAEAMYGDVIKGWQPFALDAEGKITGGVSAGLFGDATRNAAGSLSKDALDKMMSDNPAGIPTTLPARTPRAQSSAVDTILGIGGLVGGGLEAYDAKQDRRAQTSALQALADAYYGQRGGGTKPTTPTAGRAAAMADEPFDSGSSFSPTRTVNFGQPDDSDPTDLVNMPANRELIGRGVRRGFGGR